MVHGCAAFVLVIDGGVLAQDVAITDSENLVAEVAVVVFVLVEPERKSALGILLLHSLSRKGNAKRSSEEATNMMGGIAAVDMAHKGGTCEPLWDRLAPFYSNILDFVLQQEREDLSGDLVGDIGGGRTRNDADPYDDGTETPLLLLSQRCVGEEAGTVDGRPVNLPCLDQVTNMGTDRVPTPLSGVSKTPRSDLTGRWACLPTGLGKGVVRKSER